ncbi:hypothetical protein HN385_06200 [archaeon]|nr:hypothetical protein [archaeon]
MKIKTNTLIKMNQLLAKGKTIADIYDKYPRYSYDDIYWQTKYRSFVGTKRMITNRVRKLQFVNDKVSRKHLVDEIESLTDDLYYQLKQNSDLLIKIEKLLGKVNR